MHWNKMQNSYIKHRRVTSSGILKKHPPADPAGRTQGMWKEFKTRNSSRRSAGDQLSTDGKSRADRQRPSPWVCSCFGVFLFCVTLRKLGMEACPSPGEETTDKGDIAGQWEVTSGARAAQPPCYSAVTPEFLPVTPRPISSGETSDWGRGDSVIIWTGCACQPRKLKTLHTHTQKN